MAMDIAHLGRLPQLGTAELEARVGAHNINAFSPSALILTETPDIRRLGGTIRLTQGIEKRTGNWLNNLSQAIANDVMQRPRAGKIHIGLSIVDTPISVQQIKAILIEVKKILKKNKYSVRVVIGKQQILNAAEVMHNKLLRDQNREYVYFQSDRDAILTNTTAIQDINAYSERDFERPSRDSRVGMLPPKLAQIMLNLARVQPGQFILDPFCGSGVVLQEALLMGCHVFGSDLSDRMVRMTLENLDWLSKKYDIGDQQRIAQIGDARNRNWHQNIDSVITEMHLGPPLLAPPKNDELATIIREVDGLFRDTLQNIARQTTADTRVVLAAPAWLINNGIVYLPSVDQIERLGYNHVSFVHTTPPFVYAREKQIVARHILVLRRT